MNRRHPERDDPRAGAPSEKPRGPSDGPSGGLAGGLSGRLPVGTTEGAADAAEDADPDVRMRRREEQLRAYAHLLDSAVRLPGGFRVGLDGLVGLVPIVGDLVGAGLSGYLVVAAARLGIPRRTVARMVANVAVETLIGAVPLLGDAFDLVFKANERNARLLRRELERRDALRIRPDGTARGVPSTSGRASGDAPGEGEAEAKDGERARRRSPRR